MRILECHVLNSYINQRHFNLFSLLTLFLRSFVLPVSSIFTQVSYKRRFYAVIVMNKEYKKDLREYLGD